MSANKKYSLNTAQSEIMLSESVAAGSALNTVSVKLRIYDFAADEVRRAANEVLRSADIFRAIYRDGGFTTDGSIRDCVAGQPRDEAAAEEYAKKLDGSPVEYEKELYGVEVIPIEEGGSLLYARFHHVLIDGRGMSLFAQRVLDALAGKKLGYSRFFKENDGNVCAETGFWESYLSGANSATAVFPEEPEGLDKFTLCRGLDGELCGRVYNFAKEAGVNAAYVFLAAQAVYLAAATGCDQPVVLMPRLNRGAETAETLGCYVMLVPVRIKADKNDTFAEVCKNACASAKEASAHKGAGFSGILRASGARHAFSEYGLNFYHLALSSDIRYSVSFSVSGASRNHLIWNVFSSGKSIDFSFDCRKGVYDRDRAEFFADAVIDIVRSGLSGKKVCELPAVGERERARLAKIEGEEIFVDEGDTVASLLKRSAEKYADRPAVYAGDRKLTFRELDEISDSVAFGLLQKGVGRGDRVAFMLKRDWRLLPALFGIAKTGAAFVPVDPAYPEERIEYILRDSDAAFLVSSEETGRGSFVDIDRLMSAKGEKLPRVDQSDAAYIIYTSGTTGKPKGVMLSHRGIANIVKSENNPFNRFLTENCKGLAAIGSVCFDISLFEFFVPLFNGLFVELGDEQAMLNPERLAECIAAHGADALHCTPSRLISYLKNERFGEALRGVKAVLSAGEVLPKSLISQLQSRKISIFNGYGPTETTIGATITEDGDDVSIGKPIANTGVLLLSAEGNPVPFGAVGEICVYGAGVGLGYRNRPEETGERFVSVCGHDVYRTGDLGRFVDDGRLIYIGRNDRQVKLRGLRIELPEIENALLSFAGVAQAVCLVRKSSHSEHLVAFYTSAEPIDERELKAHISKALTAYMVPDVFMRLEAMPQTPGGKTDYKRLESENVDWHTEYREPTNRIERIVCEAIAGVLGRDRVGVDDDFFESGGDSLGAAELMLAIENKLGEGDTVPSYGDIYRYPTPALLAKKIVSGSEDPEAYPIKHLNYGGVGDYLVSTEGKDIPCRPLGNVLLTGATGFLGNHILAELLRSGRCEKVFCLVRSKKKTPAKKRVTSALFYYAENDFSVGDKWDAVEGDIALEEIFSEPFGEKIDTVVNCAANVAHFAYGDALVKANETGVRNLIAFANRQGARFCQISTVSVGGLAPSGEIGEKLFTERDLYIGQQIFNEYVYTKYMAEYALLRAAADDGLDVQIMRVGNLQGRLSDGEFQMNMRSNAFTRKLSAYIDIGAVPQSVYSSDVEFSPVDEVAAMIAALAGSTARGAFHVCPPVETEFKRLFAVLSELGKTVEPVPDGEFVKLLEKIKSEGRCKESVEALSMEKQDGNYAYIPFSRDRTVEILKKLGRTWNPVTDEYLKKYITALGGFDMF